MARSDFESVMIKKDLVAMALTWKDNPCMSKAEFLTGLLADGLRSRMLRGNFRVPIPLVQHLTIYELFVLAARWEDVVWTYDNNIGPLGGKYEFAIVSENSRYAEEGKDTFVPVLKGSCDYQEKKVSEGYGEFPIFDESRQPLHLFLPDDEHQNLQNWKYPVPSLPQKIQWEVPVNIEDIDGNITK